MQYDKIFGIADFFTCNIILRINTEMWCGYVISTSIFVYDMFVTF